MWPPISKKTELRLGSFLQKARIGAKLTQKDVAKELGYSKPQFISNVERGFSSPPFQFLLKVIPLYGIEKEELEKILIDEFRKTLKHYL